jgi:hypothetical protein
MTEINRKKTLRKAIELSDKFSAVMREEFKSYNGDKELHLRALVIAAVSNLITNLILENKDEELMALIVDTVGLALKEHKSDIDKCTETEEVK